MWKKANRLVLLLTAAVCVAQWWSWSSELPDPMPVHFNGAGVADGWAAKTTYLVFNALLHSLFLIGFPLLGAGLKRLPDSALNIRHKEYWLAPERREQTLAFSSELIISMGWITSWMIIAIFQLTGYVATNQKDSIAPDFYWVLGIYLVVTLLIASWSWISLQLPADKDARTSRV